MGKKYINHGAEKVDKKKDGLLDILGKKKQESEALDKESVELAKENEIEIEKDLLTQGEKILSALGYVSFLCVLPLLLKPDSKFCQFHGKQGLVLLLISLVIGFLAALIMPFSYGLWVLIRLLLIGIAVYGIYLGFTGKTKEIPVLGKLAKEFTW